MITMVEPTIRERCSQDLVVRCIHVALLCVQADATVRPLMSKVVPMILSNSVTLPVPSKPAFLSGSDSSKGLELVRHGKETPTFEDSQTSGTTASSLSSSISSEPIRTMRPDFRSR